MQNPQDVVAQLVRQNRLLKALLGTMGLSLAILLTVAAKAPDTKAKYTEIDVERINIITPDGKRELVLANRHRLPRAVINGQESDDDRGMPGIIFYNAQGDENGGLIFDGKPGEDGKPSAGMHFSMDRYGGDQQLALGHYEAGGTMESGLNVYDRGLEAEYGPLYEAFRKAPEGAEKDRLRQQWIDAGGRQTKRLFVGKTRGKSSAVILADTQGRPRIMMLVDPSGTPKLDFLDESGEVIQSLPQAAAAASTR
jgi:hypothetical protein